jgi:methionyl-tRNA synthetase
VAEESYFFRLSDYQDFLIELLDSNPQILRPDRVATKCCRSCAAACRIYPSARNEIGLLGRSGSRRRESHDLFVGSTRSRNYITAIGYGNEEKKNVGFEKYWRMRRICRQRHRRFSHGLLVFISASRGLPLPQLVFAHGLWLDAAGRKMSKTLGNSIDLEDSARQFFD